MVTENKKSNAKKYLIVLILRILETDTDVNNTITQMKIAEDISKVYPCDRKTVGRNIQYLQRLGYPIKKTTKGFYIDKKLFALEDISFIKDSIMLSQGKTEAEKQELLEKLIPIVTKQYIINDVSGE